MHAVVSIDEVTLEKYNLWVSRLKGGEEILPHQTPKEIDPCDLTCLLFQPSSTSQLIMSTFSFSFSGDDIEEDAATSDFSYLSPSSSHAAETGSLRQASKPAFPVTGQPLLPPQKHDLEAMLKALPSKIAYSTLVIKLDNGQDISIPRRELWDVRVQLMAEEDDEGLGNLGQDDVRTGVYEGGFKSWESSVDVVKELHKRSGRILGYPGHVLEVSSYLIFPWNFRT
jgi:protein-histidine N-methyltransferase